ALAPEPVDGDAASPACAGAMPALEAADRLAALAHEVQRRIVADGTLDDAGLEGADEFGFLGVALLFRLWLGLNFLIAVPRPEAARLRVHSCGEVVGGDALRLLQLAVPERLELADAMHMHAGAILDHPIRGGLGLA